MDLVCTERKGTRNQGRALRGGRWHRLRLRVRSGVLVIPREGPGPRQRKQMKTRKRDKKERSSGGLE